MADAPTPTFFPLVSKPGIKRDGTEFDGTNFVDSRWCRFQRGRPRKIGGYRSISESFQGPIRTILMHPGDAATRLYVGSTARLEYSDLSNDGVGAGIGDRTPIGFTPSDDNIWTFGELIDGVGGDSRLLANAAPNLSDIASEATAKTWIGLISGPDPLVDSTAPLVSGGVFSAPPYAIVYGQDGYYANCVPNTPTDWAGAGFNEANVTKSKIVYGAQTRGGAGASPAFLLWSLDSVIRATFVGGEPVFDFDTVSSQSSVLSSRGFIEYDGIWFWPGVDRFMMYTGVVQELPNDMNINWFFDNLNWSQRQKVWATKVPRYGEIWFWFPYGDSEDCNAAIILNVRENGTWYDTGLGDVGTEIKRTHGYFPQVFRWPVWADADQSPSTLVRVAGGSPASSSVPVPKVISTITNVGTTATATTATAHTLLSNMTITTVGQTPAQYAGTFDITVTGATTFTYVMASNPGGSASVVGTYTAATANYAFDSDLTTYTTQLAADGNISIDYGNGVMQTVSRVGFRPAATLTLDIAFQVSDQNLANWTTFFEPGSASYTANMDYYWPLLAPVPGRGFRILEQGGGTLNMAEVYFDTKGYMVLQHEFGVDRVVSGQTLAIPSFIETSDIAFVADGPLGSGWTGIDRWVQLQSIELDFIQSGDMNFTAFGQAYARGGGPEEQVDRPFTPDTWKIDNIVTRRQMRLRFTSNTQGGDYQMGQNMIWLTASSGDRPNQPSETSEADE